MDNPKISFPILSFCTGYAGLELALSRVIKGMRVVACVERCAFALANLVSKMEAGYLDAAPIWTDLATFNPAPFRGRIAMLTGGFPCQPFSSAGQKKSVRDDRHIYPLISRNVGIIRPTWVFLENVDEIAGALTDGWETVLHYVLNDLERMGYRATADIFSATETGTPHERLRFVILAKLADAKHKPRGAEQRAQSRRGNREGAQQIDVPTGSRPGGLDNTDGDGRGTPRGRERVPLPSGTSPTGLANADAGQHAQGDAIRAGRDAADDGSAATRDELANANVDRRRRKQQSRGSGSGRSESSGSGPGGLADPVRECGEAGAQRTGREAQPNADRGSEGSGLADAAELGREGMRPDWERGPYPAATEFLSRSGGVAGRIWPAGYGTAQKPFEPRRTVPNPNEGKRKGRSSRTKRGKQLKKSIGKANREADGKSPMLRALESAMGRTIDGPSDWLDYAQLCETNDSIADEIRLIGNGVVPDQLLLALITLAIELGGIDGE